MSSSPEHSRSQSPDKPFQSAQRPQDQISVEDEELNSANEQLSDIPSPLDTPTREQKLEEPGILSRSEDGRSVGGQRALDDNPNEGPPTSPPLPPRPNKFHGPASTWRNWTAPERELAASLDQLTAKDLSVHLYNAFKLRQRKEGQDGRRQSQTSKVGYEAGDVADWRPPKVWTAWPLPPGRVPREEEKHWEEKTALPAPYIVKPKMPGDALRELLVAQVLRKARHKFAERESEDVNTGGEVPTNLKPVVMADDERASEILRSTVQHLLTKLDSLLMGLHHARSAVCLPMEDSASQYRSRSRGRRASRGSARKRNRDASSKNISAGSNSEISSASGTDSTIASKSRCQSKSNIKSRLGLRDWSDVLGVASMTGWDSAVVEKAAVRCASLFGEGIEFRTLEEGREVYMERRYLNGVIAPTVGTKAKEAMGKAGADETGMVGGVHVDGYLEPIKGKKAWKYQNKGSRWEHGRPRSKQ